CVGPVRALIGHNHCQPFRLHLVTVVREDKAISVLQPVYIPDSWFKRNSVNIPVTLLQRCLKDYMAAFIVIPAKDNHLDSCVTIKKRFQRMADSTNSNIRDLFEASISVHLVMTPRSLIAVVVNVD